MHGHREPDPLLSRVDHLVYAVSDLDGALDTLQDRFGVRPELGGNHPGEGTRNALLALGPASYLEIIGPDPSGPTPSPSRWFGIDTLQSPRLVAWAANVGDLHRQRTDALRRGLALGHVRQGTRLRPDGSELSWRFTDPHTVLGDGVVPFLIDWGASSHPAQGAPGGVSLVALRAEHPAPAEVEAQLKVLGLPLPVSRGAEPALIATLMLGSGKGSIELR